MDLLTTLAPIAATLLSGPLAGLAVKFLADKVGAPDATVDAVTTALGGLATTPEGRIRLAELDAQLQQHAVDSGVDLERLAVANAADVNKTMQAEAQAEHWPTYSWRPAIGFAVALNVVASSLLVLIVFVPVMFGSAPAAAAVSNLPMVLGALAGINGTVMPVVGIASWFRGKAQADPAIPAAVRL
jgi:hypothetical protein